MRPIHVAELGGRTRPVLVLTRPMARPHLSKVTVAPITSTIRGGFAEIPLGPANGLDHACVVSLDSIATIESVALGRLVGFLLPGQERALATAISRSFDLADPEF